MPFFKLAVGILCSLEFGLHKMESTKIVDDARGEEAATISKQLSDAPWCSIRSCRRKSTKSVAQALGSARVMACPHTVSGHHTNYHSEQS